MESKVIVITGASEGIGASLARIAGSRGHRVVLAARREKELNEVARQSGSGAVFQVTDVTRRDDVQRLKKNAIDKCGKVDVWINNAGRGIMKPVMELTDRDVDEIMDVNLKSALYGMQVIVPYFQQQKKGHLINISSFLGRVPLVTFRSVYSAAKAALNSLTANLRMDLQADYPEVHVSTVMPGMVSTEFFKNAVGYSSAHPPMAAGTVPNAQTADEVSEAIMSLIEKPRAEIFTNPVSEKIARRYYDDIAAFEKGLLERA